MKPRCLLACFIMILAIFTGGCSADPVVDEEKFKQINAYVVEILPLIEDTRLDYDLWSVDVESSEKREWLSLNAERIKEIHEHYWNEDFATYEEIRGWKIPVSSGENRWTIQGDDLADALQRVELGSQEMVVLIMALDHTDDPEQLALKRDEMAPIMEDTVEAAGLLTAMFLRK